MCTGLVATGKRVEVACLLCCLLIELYWRHYDSSSKRPLEVWTLHSLGRTSKETTLVSFFSDGVIYQAFK